MRCLEVTKDFLVILLEKFGRDGGMEWHWWESVCVFKWKEKKRKQMRGREMAGQPKEWGSVWDVMGSDWSRWGTWGTQKYLTIFKIFFKAGMLHSSPFKKISSSKFYVPWS